MGGYIVEQDGQLDMVPFGSNQSPQVCSSTIDLSEVPAGATLVGLVHTHPHTPGAPVPTDGSCSGNTAPGMVYGNGPSKADLDAAATSPYPLYVIDPDEVHRVPPHYGSPVGDPAASIQNLTRNPDAECT